MLNTMIGRILGMKADSDLKPCPCCGGEAQLIEAHHFSYAVVFEDKEGFVEWNIPKGRAIVCINCLMTMPELDDEHPAEIFDTWNERKN